jgi:hypothetical protein
VAVLGVTWRARRRGSIGLGEPCVDGGREPPAAFRVPGRVEHPANHQTLPDSPLDPEAYLRALYGYPLRGPFIEDWELVRYFKSKIKEKVEERKKLAGANSVPAKSESWWLDWEQQSLEAAHSIPMGSVPGSGRARTS